MKETCFVCGTELRDGECGVCDECRHRIEDEIDYSEAERTRARLERLEAVHTDMY